MNFSEAEPALEAAWAPMSGVLFRLRRGAVDLSELDALHAVLRRVEIPKDDALLVRRVVSLLWYIPLFMEWQLERVEEAGGDRIEFQQVANRIAKEVERILGVP